MLRKATLADLDFIYTEILAGVGPGHFDKNLRYTITRFFFKRLLRRVIKTQKKGTGEIATIYICEINNVRAGFTSFSVHPDNGCELWLVAIKDNFRSQGVGTAAIIQTLRLMPPTTTYIYTRCQTTSITMMRILKRLGFSISSMDTELVFLERYIS
ncbi:GNAT family N-acetyltransferase [Enterobacter ludwigii]|uniref:GNAT family N-acetyltransferase n=1 Tax=Enterobacter ludwigii TaxID=299767 RepID=UPI003F6FBACF